MFQYHSLLLCIVIVIKITSLYIIIYNTVYNSFLMCVCVCVCGWAHFQCYGCVHSPQYIHTALFRNMAFLLARNIQSFQSLYGHVTPKFFLLNILVISLLVTVGDAASSIGNVKQLPLIIFTNIL